MNRAAVLWPLGRYDEARIALAEAISIASDPEAGFKDQLAWAELTGAQMALSLARRSEAITKARTALKLAGSEYKDVALQAKQTIAVAQAAAGSVREAAALAEEAVAAAKALGLPQLISSALLGSAEVSISAGDPKHALTSAQAAQAMFAAAGQLDSEWRAWLVMARSARLAGEKSATHDYASRAEARRAALESRLGADNYETYARRPDVQASLKSLGQMITPNQPRDSGGA